jgi:hypothetical protein
LDYALIKVGGLIMVKKWKGINEIVEKATKELVKTKKDGYLFYSAPEGYKLILSVVINEPPAWIMEIKEFGVAINGQKNSILRRGFSEGDEWMIIDSDEPILKLVENGVIGADEISRRIREESRKTRYRLQGREYP